MAAPLWVALGEPEQSRVRGISVDGAIVIAVRWTPAWPTDMPGGDPTVFPAGYYFEGGNIVASELLEEADAPSDEGWARMRDIAFRAWEEHQSKTRGASDGRTEAG